jgi:phosphoribosyl 1,2-cyclic phosphodiesterase
MHSSLLVTDSNSRIMIDCGKDWAGRFHTMNLDAIVLTHAHSDHAGGLKGGAPCPVFATAETLELLTGYAIITERRQIGAYQPFRIGQIVFEAVPVSHSLLAPAVGFNIRGARGGLQIFYVPDVAAIPNRSQALSATEIYIGDGAAVQRPILRRRDGHLIGHASIASQLSWCQQEGIRRAIFTHCGSQIVKGGDQSIRAKLRELGRSCEIAVRLAYDGLRISI